MGKLIFERLIRARNTSQGIPAGNTTTPPVVSAPTPPEQPDPAKQRRGFGIRI